MADWGQTAQLRQGLYRVLGSVFAAPSTVLFAQLREGASYLTGLGIDSFAFAGEWMKFYGELCDQDPTDLVTEHMRLFGSGLDGAICPPIESFYLASGKGGDMGVAVSNIERDYRQLGYDPVSTSLPPDHVTIEFELMSALCAREHEGWAVLDLGKVKRTMSQEHRYLEGHLGRWFPEFRQRVRASSDSFYQVAVDATHAYLVHDADFLSASRRLVPSP